MVSDRIIIQGKDISTTDGEGYDGVWIEYVNNEKVYDDEKAETWAEQLKQQILQDAEKAEKYDKAQELGHKQKPEDYLLIGQECLQRELEKDQKLIDARKKLRQKDEQLEEIRKPIQMSKNHYEVLRRQNPKLADEYTDVIRFCNHLLKILDKEGGGKIQN